MRDVAEELGEFAIYALLAMLVLTLWKRFPFRIWRYVHKGMPVLYLALAFHAAFLAPLDYWTQPVGVLLASLIAAGSVASVRVLAGRIGQDRRVGGVVESVRDAGAGVTEVVCRLDEGWRGHRPGQFAFATFDRLEGAHPFTIAGADRGDRRVRFQIKALVTTPAASRSACSRVGPCRSKAPMDASICRSRWTGGSRSGSPAASA